MVEGKIERPKNIEKSPLDLEIERYEGKVKGLQEKLEQKELRLKEVRRKYDELLDASHVKGSVSEKEGRIESTSEMRSLLHEKIDLIVEAKNLDLEIQDYEMRILNIVDMKKKAS